MSQSACAGDPVAISGVVLAAGTSSRLAGSTPKQLLLFEGQALVQRAARVVQSSNVIETIVVVGHAQEQVRAALEGLDVVIATNANYREGQSTSVRTGIRHVSTRSAAALITPCDQPLLDQRLINALIDTFVATGAPAVVPEHRGRRGAPALIARALFPAIEDLVGDTGARRVLADLGDDVATVAIESDFPLLDIDSIEDLATIEALTLPR